MKIRSIALESFKSYSELQKIPMRDMTLFMGANSSGKTSAIQALLVLKQTMESSSQDIDLLLSGKYANIGDFHDAVNSDHDKIEIGLVAGDNVDETYLNSFSWLFVPVDERKTAALLEELKLSVPDGVIELRRISVNSEENRFQYYLNGEPTQYFSRIINLQIVDMDLGYNSDLNTMFCDYLSELSQIIFTGKDSRAPEISREEFAPLNALLAFEDAILSGLPVQRSKAENHNFLLSLTNSFCSKLTEDSYSDYWISASLRKYCWNSLMAMKDKLVHFREVYDKYYAKLETFCSTGDYRNKLDKTVCVDPIFRSSRANSAVQFDTIRQAQSAYSYLTNLLKKRITYLGPLRERPQGLYNIGFESAPKYVGPSGAFFASVLLHENKVRPYLLPYNEKNNVSLSEACARWLDYLGIANDVRAEKQGSFGVRVSVSSLNNQDSDILNVGIGTSQVLPVLLSGLLSGQGDVLLFEQPELHLHPFSQSRLADFFVMLSNHDRQVIVETHSETLLMRLRYLVLDNEINVDNVAVVFFQNKEGTVIKEARLDGYGGIDYPEDFRDTNERLIEALLRKSLAKRRKERD